MNNLLLDSHILLWSLTSDKKLSRTTKQLILTTPRVFVSAVSLFELRMKTARQKLTLPANIEQLILNQSFTMLDLTASQLHDYRIFHPQNPDPFDNALLAIAEAQHFHFLTADSAILPLQASYAWIVNGG